MPKHPPLRPIRVFFSDVDQRFYATRNWVERDGHVDCTGPKFDVTNDVANIVTTYRIRFKPRSDENA